MKNILVLLFVVLSSTFVFAQTTSDKDFNQRLDIYMRLNRELEFDELMNFTHPRAFELAPKEQIAQLLKSAYDNPEFKMSLDSISITDISAPFKFENSNYRKIEYRMLAGLKFNDTSLTSDKEDIERIINSLESSFQGGNITFDETTRWFRINAITIMFGIKDMDKPWLFLGYQKDSPQLMKIYPSEVLSHFKL